MFRPRPASILIVLVLAIACFDIASSLEHWPFGSYPMYSLTYSQQLVWLRLYGVDGTREFPLLGDQNFAPFDEARLVGALELVQKSDRDGHALARAMRNLLRLHNSHANTPIRGLRLYSVTWSLRPGLEGNEPPDQKILIAEVSSSDH